MIATGSTLLGTLVLVLFFVAFVGIAIWAYLPAQRQKMKSYGEIPLRGDTDGRARE